MEYISPHDQLFDLIEEYKIHYGYSTMEAISEMRKALQAKKKTLRHEADYGVKFGKYQTI